MNHWCYDYFLAFAIFPYKIKEISVRVAKGAVDDKFISHYKELTAVPGTQ